MSSETEITADETMTDVVDSSVTDTTSIQTSIVTTTGLERLLTVTVPADNIDSKVVERIRDAMGKANVKGFRRGKVPFKVIKQRFGAGLRQEVLSEVVNETFQQAMDKESIRSVAQPDISLKEFGEGKDLQYTATFEIYPQITLNDFSSIEVTALSAALEEDNIDKMVQKLRRQRAAYEPVERAAAVDDQVTIDYLGTKEGEPFEGGKAEDYTLTLGAATMIPGFEEAIVGMHAGAEKVVSLTFPEDYHPEELKGADIEFTIQLKQVAEQILPPLDERFLADFGIFDGDMDKFRAEVRASMQRELEGAAMKNIKQQVIDKLIEIHELTLPKILIANEIEALRQKMISQYPAIENSQDVDYKSIFPDDKLTKEAERRISFALLALEISKSHDIKVDQERVMSSIKVFAESYEEPEVVVNHYYQTPQLLNRVQSSVLEDQVIDVILEQARVNNKKVDYFELIKH